MRTFMQTCFLLWLLIVGTEAAAMIQMYPMGHLEALTAGTGIALLGSPSGLIYNPASLGGVHNSSLSLSGSSYYLMKADFIGGNAQLTSWQAVPNSTVGAWKVGGGALALGIFVPLNFSFSVRGSFPGNIGDVDMVVNRTLNVAGTAWGYKIAGSDACERCGLYGGFAILGAYESGQVLSSSVDAVGNKIGTVDVRTSAISTFSSAGLIWHISPELNFGFRLQSPYMLINSTAEGNGYQLKPDANTGLPILKKSTGAPADATMEGWGGGIGLEWRASQQIILLSDFTISESRRQLSGQQSRAPVGAGLAGRYRLGRSMAAVAGVRADLTDLFVTDANTQTYGFAALATAGLMWRQKDFETALGLFDYQYFPISIPDALRNEVGRLGEEQITFLGAMISGLYRF